MLEAIIRNVGSKHLSKATTISSSIKLTIKGANVLNFSFNFKAMVIATCKASNSNRCPWDWFNT